jgi:hypothetical protein
VLGLRLHLSYLVIGQILFGYVAHFLTIYLIVYTIQVVLEFSKSFRSSVEPILSFLDDT